MTLAIDSYPSSDSLVGISFDTEYIEFEVVPPNFVTAFLLFVRYECAL